MWAAYTDCNETVPLIVLHLQLMNFQLLCNVITYLEQSYVAYVVAGISLLLNHSFN